MSSADPPKHKRSGRKGDSPTGKSEEIPPTPANDAGVSLFGVPLDDEGLARGAKLSLWTVTEAVYLSAGCKPPNAELPIPSFSLDAVWLDEPISYRRTLFERHMLTSERGTLIAPMEALELLIRKKEWFDPKMREAVLHFHSLKPKTGRQAGLTTLGDLMPQDDEDDERPEALKRKLSTARKILFGIAVKRLGHNPRSYRNSTSKVIEGIMKDAKLDTDEDTIRKHLKAGQEEHWVDPDL